MREGDEGEGGEEELKDARGAMVRLSSDHDLLIMHGAQ